MPDAEKKTKKKEMDVCVISSDDDAPADPKSHKGELGYGLDTLDPVDFSNNAPAEHVPPPTPCKEFTEFMERVYITLLSTGTVGYGSAVELNRDLFYDTGLDGGKLAQKFGYSSMDDFLRSAEMKDRVLVDKGNTYRAIPLPQYLEIYEVMAASYEEKCKRETSLRGESDGRQKGVPFLRVTPINFSIDMNEVHPPLVMSTAKLEAKTTTKKKEEEDGGEDALPRRLRLVDTFDE